MTQRDSTIDFVVFLVLDGNCAHDNESKIISIDFESSFKSGLFLVLSVWSVMSSEYQPCVLFSERVAFNKHFRDALCSSPLIICVPAVCLVGLAYQKTALLSPCISL